MADLRISDLDKQKMYEYSPVMWYEMIGERLADVSNSGVRVRIAFQEENWIIVEVFLPKEISKSADLWRDYADQKYVLSDQTEKVVLYNCAVHPSGSHGSVHEST